MSFYHVRRTMFTAEGLKLGNCVFNALCVHRGLYFNSMKAFRSAASMPH